MKKGFTKAWRKELDSDIWAMPPLYHRVWFWIRQKAQHEVFLFPTPKFGIWVLPGQRLTSLQQIAEGVKWYEWGKEIIPNKKTIKDIISSLELWGMIEVESNSKGTLITIVNWDTYNNVVTEESNAGVTPTGYKKRMKENEENIGIKIPTAATREESKSECSFSQCFTANEQRIKELFPKADFAIEKELCIAHYRSHAPPIDPYPVILKWFKRTNNGGNNDATTSKGSSGKTIRKTPILAVGGAGTDFLDGF